MRFIAILIIFAIGNISLQAQEYLVPLEGNNLLLHQKRTEPLIKSARARQAASLNLPFIEDFSNRSHYPNAAKWTDREVYINSNLPIHPPSIGVATFDGLKEDGTPYSLKKKAYGPADTLTSLPIDLSSLSPADSLLLTFYLEPKGLGDAPGSKDSFLLEFKVNDSTWQRVFSITSSGMAPDSFRLFLVKVNKNKFFKPDFQFRFRNYATLTGNVDHWHLDYVILDKDRSVQNLLLNDVAFNRPARSLLRDYHAMPLNQFIGFEDDELSDSLYASAVNHFNVIKNTTFRYRAVENCTGSVLKSDFFQTINFPPLSDTVLKEANFKTEIKNLTATISCDSLTIRTRYVLFNSPPDPATGFNDTIFHTQRFFNYFAYDDGSAERGYLVVGKNPKLAVKFKLNKPDSLRAIEVHFPHIDKNLNRQFVNLIVWESIDGATGADDSVRYRKDVIHPEYVDSLNGFYTYVLDSAIYMQDSFYVGFQRYNADSLQIGFDMNSPRSGKLFFYSNGSWRSSLFSGTVMIRPVTGAPLNIHSGVEEVHAKSEWNVYPNPARDHVYLPEGEYINAHYLILDINGRVRQNGVLNNSYIAFQNLSPGFYLLRILSEESPEERNIKIIIQ